MSDILIQACSFLLVIFFGFLMKRIGWLNKTDGSRISTIIVFITLPAAIIVSLAEVKVSSLFFILIGIGFLLNVLLIFFGNLIWRKRPPLDRTFMMYCISGYNIGNFSLPFIQGFFPAAAPFLCMFDIGNSFMLSGGTVIMAAHLTKDEHIQLTFTGILKRLFQSLPFLTYFCLFLLKCFSLPIPDLVIRLLQPIANANGFLSMFMIGLYLELRLPRQALSSVKSILFWRYAAGIILAILFQQCSFFSAEVRIVLMLLAVAPVPTFAVINSVQAGIKEETAGFLSSISILISLVLMTVVTLLSLH